MENLGVKLLIYLRMEILRGTVVPVSYFRSLFLFLSLSLTSSFSSSNTFRLKDITVSPSCFGVEKV